MSDYNTAARVIAGKVIADEVKQGLDDLRMRLTYQMRIGDRIVGEHEGVRLGAITKCEGRKRAVVIDEGAFLTYVAVNYPDEIVRMVRDAFRDKLLQQMLHDGCDTKTGAVVPGVEIREGDPYLMVKPTPEGKEWIKNQIGGQLRAIGSP